MRKRDRIAREQQQPPTWKQLAELRGVVVTPEEAQRHYRRLARNGIIVVWTAVAIWVGILVAVRLAVDY